MKQQALMFTSAYTLCYKHLGSSTSVDICYIEIYVNQKINLSGIPPII